MPTPIVNADRDRQILSQRAAGASLAAIGATHGISRQRVHAILKTAGRDNAADPDKIEAELYLFLSAACQEVSQ